MNLNPDISHRNLEKFSVEIISRDVNFSINKNLVED